MKIAGYLKTSLIEWPGKISSVIFTQGCNFKCPFCHNAELVGKRGSTRIPEKQIFADLKERRKWIDAVVLSVGSKEPVVVRNNELLSYPKIEDLWGSNKKTYFDKEGKIAIERQSLEGINCLTYDGFQPVNEIIRHKTREIFRIICGPGNYEILVTSNHSVFVVNAKGFLPKRVDELTSSDWLLSARRIPQVQQPVSRISILDYVELRGINKKIREGKIGYWQKIISQVGKKTISELSREFGHERKTIREYYHLSQNNYKNLLDEWIIDNNYIRNRTSRAKIPVNLTLGSDFGEFLGYAAAEGSVCYRDGGDLIGSYVFSLGNEPVLAKRILFLYRKIFKTEKGTIIKKINIKRNYQYSVIVGGKVVGGFISALVGKGFANKRIPDIIFNAPGGTQKTFIKALLEGDGYERVRKNRSQQECSLKTGSQKLAQDLILLSRMVGCFCWIEKDNNYFKVVFSQNDLIKIKERKKLSLKYSFRTRVEGIPRQLLGYTLRGQKRIQRDELLKWFDLSNCKRKAAAIKFGLIDKDGNTTLKLDRIRLLYELTEKWDIKEIKKVEKIDLEEEEYVYDLVVSSNHSFVAGTGMLLVHNTGGEPTLQTDLYDFIKKLKQMGFLTMIHTNGTKPKTINELIIIELTDYIAMDIKGNFDNYQNFTNVKSEISNVKSSMKLIVESGVEHEFRTTVVPGLHNKENLVQLAKDMNELIENCLPYKGKLKIENCRWFLQQFRPTNTVDKSYMKIEPYSKKEMESFQKELQKIIPGVQLRGV